MRIRWDIMVELEDSDFHLSTMQKYFLFVTTFMLCTFTIAHYSCIAIPVKFANLNVHLGRKPDFQYSTVVLLTMLNTYSIWMQLVSSLCKPYIGKAIEIRFTYEGPPSHVSFNIKTYKYYMQIFCFNKYMYGIVICIADAFTLQS